MKKIIALLLALVMVFALCACGGSAKEEQTYTIRIEGATYQQYRRILDICPLAEATKEVTDHD